MLSSRELAVLTLLFVCSLPAVTARLYSSDEVQYFSYLRSLWFDHDVSFENEYRYFYDHGIAQSAAFHQTFLELQTPAGRRINYGTIGCAVLWSPFYGAADIVARAARAAGYDVAVDGYSRPYIMAVAYGSAFYGFATIAPDSPSATAPRTVHVRLTCSQTVTNTATATAEHACENGGAMYM